MSLEKGTYGEVRAVATSAVMEVSSCLASTATVFVQNIRCFKIGAFDASNNRMGMLRFEYRINF